MKRSIRERSPSGSSGASSRTSAVLSAASDCTTSSARPVDPRDLLRRRLAAELLAERLRGADDAGEVGGAVERHPHGAAVAGQRGEDRLPDPPDGVGDELDALVGVELPRGGEEPDVALADQVGERHAPVLILLGHRDHEPQVPLDQLLHRLGVALPHLPGDGDLLLGGEEWGLADLVEVLVEDVLVGVVDAEALGGVALARLARLGGGPVRQDLGGGEVVGERDRGGVRRPLGGPLRRVLAGGFLLLHGWNILSSA